MLAKEIYAYIYNNIAKNITDQKEVEAITKLILHKTLKCDISAIVKNISIDNFDEKYLNKIFYHLKRHEPIQYILGVCDFLDFELFVDENVLIPRQETQELCYNLRKNYNFNGKNILDLCCGSGCIAIAMKKYFKTSNVFAVDISEYALDVARKNAKKNDTDINFIQYDIFSEKIFNIGKFDVIISNPPYVCESEKKYMQKNILDYEPGIALFVKDDKYLKFYERIVDIIPKILNKNGFVFCEINERFGLNVKTLFRNLYFEKLEIKKDNNGKDRHIYAERYKNSN